MECSTCKNFFPILSQNLSHYTFYPVILGQLCGTIPYKAIAIWRTMFEDGSHVSLWSSLSPHSGSSHSANQTFLAPLNIPHVTKFPELTDLNHPPTYAVVWQHSKKQ